MPLGKSCRTSRRSPHALATGPTIPSSRHICGCDRAGSLKPRKNGWRAQHQLDGNGHIFGGLIEAIRQFMDAAFVDIETDSARPDQSASEPAAAKQRGHIEEIAANSAAIGHGWKISHVAGQSAQISGMVGQPLQFERDAPQKCGSGGNLATGERFHGMAICRGMADGCVSGSGFYQMNPAFGGSAQHRGLYAAMLVSQRDFEMVDIFAVALESEMARLDDARVNRSDGHLVYLRPAHLEIIRNANRIGCLRRRPRCPSDRMDENESA